MILLNQLSGSDKIYALLRLISVIGGICSVALNPIYSNEILLYYIFGVFSCYSILLMLSIIKRPDFAFSLYRISLVFDFIFIILLIKYTGGLASHFYFAFYILASLYTFNYGIKLGLTIASISTITFLAIGNKQFNDVYFGDIALEIAFLYIATLSIGFFSNENKLQASEKIKLYEDMKSMYYNIIQGFVAAIDAKDTYTRGHSEQVTIYSKAIAEKLNLTKSEIDLISNAALLHDIGKIGIDEAILRKPAKLNSKEFNKIKSHPSIGAQILSEVKSLKDIIPIIYHHHERYDGNGYIEGLREGQVPIGARIIAVADAFEAMTSDRPYRRALSIDEAIAELRTCSGTQFDPKIVEVFVNILKQKGNMLKLVI